MRAARRVLGREIIGHREDEPGGEQVTHHAPLSDAVAFIANVLSASADDPSVASRQIGFVGGPGSCFRRTRERKFLTPYTLSRSWFFPGGSGLFPSRYPRRDRASRGVVADAE